MENRFETYFKRKDQILPSTKWHHYLEIYEKHFNRFVNKSPTILEIGVFDGGSMELWNYYFGKGSKIYGVDIDKRCLEVPNILNVDNIQVDIGDQGSVEFWKNYLKDKPKFDIVIEDGGHRPDQQITTFMLLFNHLNDDGVYLCEDLHTNYWEEYGGGYKKPDTFIEFSKNIIDGLNSQYIREDIPDIEVLKKFRSTTKSVNFYDSVIVFEKGKIKKSHEISTKTYE